MGTKEAGPLFKKLFLPFVEHAGCYAMFLAHIGNIGPLKQGLPQDGHLFLPGIVATWVAGQRTLPALPGGAGYGGGPAH